MAFLNPDLAARVKNVLAQLTDEVKIKVFTMELECGSCADNRQLLLEVAGLSDRIKIEVFDFILNKEAAERYRIDKIPAISVEGAKDYGIRFYGIPAGYEFTSLIETIKLVSSGSSGLAPATKERLKTLARPAHVQVFVTLTCPYCPLAVKLAHQFALENNLIRSDMVNTQDFPYLAQRYGVMSVPKIVINETTSFEGTTPELLFLEHILRA